MNPIQEQFFDQSYAATLQALGISQDNEKIASFFSLFKRAPKTPGAQVGQDVAQHLKANAPNRLYKTDPMADVVSARRLAQKKNVDLNQLYTGSKTTGSIADQIPKTPEAGPQLGMWDKTKAWWGNRSPWAKAGIGAAAALPIAGGLYAAGGMNPPRPQTLDQRLQQY